MRHCEPPGRRQRVARMRAPDERDSARVVMTGSAPPRRAQQRSRRDDRLRESIQVCAPGWRDCLVARLLAMTGK
jgi:hypothetical protein